MADQTDIEFKIKSVVDDSKATKTLGDLKKNALAGGKSIDGLTKNMKSLGKEANHTESAFKSMFKALTVEKLLEKGFEVVLDFFHESIDAAKEAEVTTSNLKNTLHNIGDDDSFGKLTKSAEDFGKTYGFTTDEVEQAQAKLLASGRFTTDEVIKLQPQIADLARSTGESYDEASQKVLKAVEGNKKALKDFGVQVDASKSSTENLKSVTDGLSSSIGGAADAFNKTGAGAIANFQVQIKDLQEDLGKKLLPVIGNLATKLMPIFEQLIPVIEKLFNAFSPIIDIFSNLLATILPPLIKILDKLFSIFNKIIKPIGDLLQVVGEIVAIFLDALMPAIDGVADAFVPLIQELLPQITDLLNYLKPVITVIAQIFGKLATVLVTILEPIFRVLIEDVFPILIKGIKLIGKVLGPVVKLFVKLYEAAKKVVGKLKEYFGIKPKSDFLRKSVEEHIEALDKENDALLAASKTKKRIEKDDAVASKEAEKEAKKEEERKKKAFERSLKSLQENIALSIEATKAGSKERLDAENAGIDAELKALNQGFADKIIDEEEYTDKVKKLLADKQKSQKEFDKKQKEDAEKSTIARLELTELEAKDAKSKFDASLALLEEKNKKSLENEELTADERKLLIAKNEKEITKLKKDYADKEVQDKLNLAATTDQIELDKISKLKGHETERLAAEQKLSNDKIAILQNEEQLALQNTELTESARAEIIAKYEDQITKEKQTQLDKRKKYQEDAQAAEFKSASDVMSAIDSLDQLFTEIAGNRNNQSAAQKEKTARKEFAINKALQISNAVMQGIQGVLAAYASGSATPIVGAVLGPIDAAAAGAVAAANVAKIAASQFKSSGSGASISASTGGGGSPSMGSGGAQFNAPQFFGLGNKAIADHSKSLPSPVVKVSDINNVQGNVATIDRRSTLGHH